MGIENLPAANDDAFEQDENKSVFDEVQALQEQFDDLPETESENKFPVGAEIMAPTPEGKSVAWQIVKAENGLYIAESRGDGEEYFATFSEDEVSEFGNDPAEVGAQFEEKYEQMNIAERAYLKALTLPNANEIVRLYVVQNAEAERNDAYGISDEKFLEMTEEEINALQETLIQDYKKGKLKTSEQTNS